MNNRRFKIESSKFRSFIEIGMQRGVKIYFSLRVLVVVIGAIRIVCWMRVRNNNTVCINVRMFILY